MILDPTDDILQQELNKFYIFTENHKIFININKYFVAQFTRSKKFDFQPEFAIGGLEIMEVKKELKFFGVMVQK